MKHLKEKVLWQNHEEHHHQELDQSFCTFLRLQTCHIFSLTSYQPLWNEMSTSFVSLVSSWAEILSRQSVVPVLVSQIYGSSVVLFGSMLNWYTGCDDVLTQTKWVSCAKGSLLSLFESTGRWTSAVKHCPTPLFARHVRFFQQSVNEGSTERTWSHLTWLMSEEMGGPAGAITPTWQRGGSNERLHGAVCLQGHNKAV